MSCNKCGSACNCLGVIISIVFGAVIGILFAFEFIPNIVTATWIAFGLGVLVLLILVAAIFLSVLSSSRVLTSCLCNNITSLLVGIIGTIISALAALSIELSTAFISVIALVAIGAFFFAFMVISLITFINCIMCHSCSGFGEE